MTPACGTRAAIVAHLMFGEALDGPCAAADAAMRMEAERRQPYEQQNSAMVDTPALCAHRRFVLDVETLAWQRDHPRFTR